MLRTTRETVCMVAQVGMIPFPVLIFTYRLHGSGLIEFKIICCFSLRSLIGTYEFLGFLVDSLLGKKQAKQCVLLPIQIKIVNFPL